MVEEKFQWMTERSPVTLLRGKEVKVCRAELLFDRSSSSHKRLSQTSAVDLCGPGGSTFHTATLPLHLVCLSLAFSFSSLTPSVWVNVEQVLLSDFLVYMIFLL